MNGRPDEIERVLRKMMEEAKAGARRPYDVAHVATMQGDHSLALEWLEKSYQPASGSRRALISKAGGAQTQVFGH